MDFGPLLRRYRDAAELTQEHLANELRRMGYRYSNADVSKWENARKVPPEEVVEELEVMMGVPPGVLLRAAGFISAAEYRRMVTGDQELAQRQIEHIKSLQELARSAIDTAATLSPHAENCELDAALSAMWQLYARLTKNPLWRSLADHLGDEAASFERTASRLEPASLVPPWDKGEPTESYRQLLGKAWMQVFNLQIIADSGDTMEWEYCGLNAKCPWCPA